MNRWAPHFFAERAREAGLPEDQITEVAAHYEHARRLGIAPVISLSHMAFSCGVEYRHLRNRCARQPITTVDGSRSRPYRTFAVRKRSGGTRLISVPADDLLQVQRWINHNILSRCSCHSRAFAYQAGSSIADCASIHLGCRWLIKLDLVRFFESITERQVYRVFAGLGYPRLVSFELARLCTRVDRVSRKRKEAPKWQSSRWDTAIPDYSHSVVGYLPQGAPTSPMLSNLVARGLDRALDSIADELRGEYSRYSDDMYFSFADGSFSKSDAARLVRRVGIQAKRHGFDLNQAKTAIAGPGHRRLVLGILVDRDRLRLCRAFRRRLEWHYRHCLANPAAHAVCKAFDSVAGLKNHVNGLLAFARSVDPEYVASLEERPIAWPV